MIDTVSSHDEEELRPQWLVELTDKMMDKINGAAGSLVGVDIADLRLLVKEVNHLAKMEVEAETLNAFVAAIRESIRTGTFSQRRIETLLRIFANYGD